MNTMEIMTRAKSEPIPVEWLEAAKRNTFCCIREGCHSGRGEHGTGMQLEKNGTQLKCWSCGSFFSLIDVMAHRLGIPVTGAKYAENDWQTIIKAVADYLGLPLDSYKGNHSGAHIKKKGTTTAMNTTNTPTAETSANKTEADKAELERKEREQKLIREDIARARANLDNLPENARRGLSLETLRHFGCGYLQAWKAPKSLAEGKNPPPSRRLIIPTSEKHYLASAIDRDKIDSQWWKMHAGSKEPFNVAALATEGIVIVAEGELDAMSIWQAMGGRVSVIAIGGAAEDNWIKLAGDKVQFLIVFDNDAAGKKNAEKLRETLIDKGYPATIGFLSDGDTKTDANDILRMAGGAVVLADKINALISGAQADLEKAAAEIQERIEFDEGLAEWTVDNGEISPAALKKLQADMAYLRKLTQDKITPANARSSRTLNAVANCRFYDPAINVAEIFMARVDAVRAGAQREIKQAPPEMVISDDVRALAAIPARNALDDSIAKFTTQISKAHKNYQKELERRREAAEYERRRAAREQILSDNFSRLQELKAMEPSPERDDEMRAIIADMCTWYTDKYDNPVAVKGSAANFNLIFENDPVISGLAGFDEFRQTDAMLKPAPWKKKFKGIEQWQDADDSQLRMYLRETYTDIPTNLLYTDVFTKYSRLHAFNEVQEWLANLPKWDGVERAASIFIDYLRADDTRYTRELTLNWLLGTLARAFYPGCEYQLALVLNGAQGIGKSGVTKMLAGAWYVSLKDSVEDSHAQDTIENAWICEIEEFWAGTRAECNALKAFLSAAADDRRTAYARRARKIPRHCTFLVTCNNNAFLKDVTGNRRFGIIKCNAAKGDSSAIKRLSKETVAQIWAEALCKFKEKFPTDAEFDAVKLELPDDVRNQAEEFADEHMVDDGLAAEIKAYVDTPIPSLPIWRALSKEQRRKFFIDGSIELEAFQWHAARARLRTVADRDAFDEALAKGDERIVNLPGESKKFIRFVGTYIRKFTFAAEFCNEYLGTSGRKYILRVGEYLAVMDGWTKGERLRGEPSYGDVRSVYYRIADSEHEPPATDNSDSEHETPSTGNSDDYPDSYFENADLPF